MIMGLFQERRSGFDGAIGSCQAFPRVAPDAPWDATIKGGLAELPDLQRVGP